MPAIEKRYAQALGDICEKKNLFDPVSESFHQFMDVLMSNKELNILLTSPGIKNQLKKETLKKLLEKDFDPILKNLIFLLIDKNRIDELPSIYIEFKKIAEAKKSLLKMKIFSSHELLKEQIESIKQIYLKKYNMKQVSAEIVLDKTLLGGLKIQIGDTVIDGTIKGRLEQLAKQII